MADRSVLENKWDLMKGRITEAWGALTDDDMQRLEGRWDQVVATIREKTDAGIETIEAKLDEMIDSLERESVSNTS